LGGFLLLKASKQPEITDRFSSNTPSFFRTSAKIGTVELTGFEMMATRALGQALATALARSRTIPALVYTPRWASQAAEPVMLVPPSEQLTFC
jgi:hypothetical protein